MVTRRRLSILGSFLSLALFGCAEAETNPTGGGGAGPEGGSDAGGASLGGGGAGGEGGEGGSPPMTSCVPVDGLLVGESCGLFVDPSASLGGDGSQLTPYRNVSDAIVASGAETPIFVCAGELDDNVVVDASRAVFAGLACDPEWRWDLAGRTQLTADHGTIPLLIVGGPTAQAPTQVSGFEVTAQDGLLISESSIAALIDGGFTSLERLSLTAGDGMSGNPTEPGQAPAGSAGQPGGDGVGIVGGGVGGDSLCGSVGGAGGAQIAGFNTSGAEGEPDQNNGGATVGNLGAAVCENGTVGASGAAGVDGVDAAGVGTLDLLGFTPASGTPGADGTHGGGGGGGGSVLNSAGGGGGGGGCGGSGGVAGLGGGSSIALIALEASVLFSDVIFAVGQGGDGGFGWLGGTGGAAGAGGQGVGTACDGAAGGVGGAGGKGGDGAGGHAIVVAYTGLSPILDGVQLPEPVAAQAGEGANDAPDGIAAQSAQF